MHRDSQHLYGLGKSYNIISSRLNRALPLAYRHDDPQADLLLSAYSRRLSAVDRPSAKCTESLFELCRRYATQQYTTKSEDSNTDFKDMWLSVLVLGSRWNDAIGGILGFSFAECFGRVGELRLVPTTPRLYLEEPQVRCDLASAFFCDSNEYDEFDRLVKSPYELRTSYDSKQQIVTFLDRKYLEAMDKDVTCGRAPKWLSWLLKRNAVETLTIKYPYERNDCIGIKRVIRKVLVLPDCPDTAKKDRQAQLSSEVHRISGELEVGIGPFFTIATQMNETWIPFINAVVECRCSRLVGECNNSDMSQSTEYIVASLARCLALDSSPIMRSDFEAEYPDLAKYCFEKRHTENSDDFDRKSTFSIGEYSKLGEHILSRIGDLHHLDCSIRYFCNFVNGLLSELGCHVPETADSSSAELDTSSGSVSRPSAVNPHSIALVPFSIFLEHLRTIHELKAVIDKWLATMDDERISWLFPASNIISPSDLSILTQSCCEVLLSTSNPDIRVSMLAALLYLYTNQDVLPDTEDQGLDDDLYVLASEIKSLEGSEKANLRDPKAYSLATDFVANIDQYIPPSLRHQIEMRIREIKSTLKSIRKRKSRTADNDAAS